MIVVVIDYTLFLHWMIFGMWFPCSFNVTIKLGQHLALRFGHLELGCIQPDNMLVNRMMTLPLLKMNLMVYCGQQLLFKSGL